MAPPLPAAPPIPKTSPQAVWSLVLGILSTTCLWLLGSIPAILLGRAAIKKIDASGGTLTGRGLAVAGIITGSVGILLGFITVGSVLAALALPAFNQVQNQAKLTRQMSQIKQITLGCRLHAAQNAGAFPADLETLVQSGHLDALVLIGDHAGNRRYLYRPGLSDAAAAEEPLLAAPFPLGGKRAMGRLDGRVETIPEVDFQADYAHLFPHQ